MEAKVLWVCTSDGAIKADSLVGTAGDDEINAFDGSDTIDGAAGDDVLNGGDGNDTNIARPGDNLLIGGAGANLVDYFLRMTRSWPAIRPGSTSTLEKTFDQFVLT